MNIKVERQRESTDDIQVTERGVALDTRTEVRSGGMNHQLRNKRDQQIEKILMKVEAQPSQ